MYFWRHAEVTREAVRLVFDGDGEIEASKLRPDNDKKIPVIAERLADASRAIDFGDQATAWKHCMRDRWSGKDRQTLLRELRDWRIPELMKNVTRHNCIEKIKEHRCFEECICQGRSPDDVYKEALAGQRRRESGGRGSPLNDDVVRTMGQTRLRKELDGRIHNSALINDVCPNGCGATDKGVGLIMHIIQDYHSRLHNGAELAPSGTCLYPPDFVLHVGVEWGFEPHRHLAVRDTRRFLSKGDIQFFLDDLSADWDPHSFLEQEILKHFDDALVNASTFPVLD